MMWVANDGGPMYSFQTYSKTPLMLSMLGGVVGDEAPGRSPLVVRRRPAERAADEAAGESRLFLMADARLD